MSGLSQTEHAILCAMRDDPALTPEQIARRIGRNWRTVYQRRHRLAKAGLVRLPPAELTPAGEAELRAMPPVPGPVPLPKSRPRPDTGLTETAEAVICGIADAWAQAGRGPSQAELADRAETSLSALARVLGRLEGQELISAERTAGGNRRDGTLALTAKGARLYMEEL